MIKAVVMDVDGVLTDGSFGLDEFGQEYKRFSFYDVMGVSLGRKKGLAFAIITGEDNAIIDKIADKMRIEDVYKGSKEKAKDLKAYAKKKEMQLSDICFIGDDVNDLPALKIAGLSVAPSSAPEQIKEKAAMVTMAKGGHGAVREVIDHITANNIHQ